MSNDDAVFQYYGRNPNTEYHMQTEIIRGGDETWEEYLSQHGINEEDLQNIATMGGGDTKTTVISLVKPLARKAATRLSDVSDINIMNLL